MSPDESTDTYTRRALFVRAKDGDTVVLDVDLGYGVWKKQQTFRLLDVDTPELRGEERERGLSAKDFVEKILAASDLIFVQSFKSEEFDKYGRWLAFVWFRSAIGRLELLNTAIVREGHTK